MEEEIWLPLVDFEDRYMASSIGRIKTIDRISIDKNNIKTQLKSKILKISEWGAYYNVTLVNNKSERHMFVVHRMVAKTFIPNPKNKPFINHINGIKSDNRVKNLEWCTASENQIHAYKNELRIPLEGEFHQNTKLTNAEVKKIRYLYHVDKNYSQRGLAKKYFVTQATIHNIVNFKQRKNAV